MKTIILLSALFVATVGVNAQSKNDTEYPWVSVGAVSSYEPTSRTSDQDHYTLGAQVKVGAIYSNVEVAVKYKNMPEIKLQELGVQVNLVAYPMRNFDLVAGVEFGGINRTGNSNAFYLAGNMELRFNLTRSVLVAAQVTMQTRNDIGYFYDYKSVPIKANGAINVYYKLN